MLQLKIIFVSTPFGTSIISHTTLHAITIGNPVGFIEQSNKLINTGSEQLDCMFVAAVTLILFCCMLCSYKSACILVMCQNV